MTDLELMELLYENGYSADLENLISLKEGISDGTIILEEEKDPRDITYGKGNKGLDISAISGDPNKTYGKGNDGIDISLIKEYLKNKKKK